MSAAVTALVAKILFGAGILFVIGYIGNLLSFSNRVVNALVTAIVFAVIYGALYYFIDKAMLPPDLQQISQQQWIQMIGLSAALVFVIDLVANMMTFSNRFVNALATAIVFAVLGGALLYFGGGVPEAVPA